ncbi:MAG TPA: SLC13 family permease [Gemmatimonadales bacterium]|nr:SLC13 family permease [Gemmatimonadales bacterium]
MLRASREPGRVEAGAFLATVVLATGAGLGAVSIVLDWPPATRAAILASVCLVLWLGQLVPVWLPTLVLWAGASILLAGQGDRFAPGRVLGWFSDPVLLLFLAGFALATAAQRQKADQALAALTLRLSRGHAARLVALAAGATALLSMWMSNIAASALLFGTLRPVWASRPAHDRLRRSLLVAIALAADVGGIATPIGTGPNGIAIAAVSHDVRLDFLDWMLFALPLALGLVMAAVGLVLLILRPLGRLELAPMERLEAGPRRQTLGIIFGATIVFWLSEPLHGVGAPVVALGSIVALLASGVLRVQDVARLDWPTLMLIAGGIGLGRLLEAAGLMSAVSDRLLLADLPSYLRHLAMALVAATMSSLMSNTGTAAVLIPLAAAVDPLPSTIIIVAVACSLGVPFAISTPPNAMASAAGVRARDLLLPGLVILVGGCAIVALTGPLVLNALGIP